MNEIAKEFLTRCFAPGETIALLLRNENPVIDHDSELSRSNECSRLVIWLARS